ncbi:MAG: adenylate/guanylate cyclase domain-containing protein [Hyphomicrobiaceae bacterium]
MKRKIAAILAADAPGYAGLLASDRIATLSALQAARRVFDEAVRAHDGRIFNTSGASVLAEFSSAVEAVRCALAVQSKVQAAAHAGSVPAGSVPRRLGFRIGLTIGDIVEHEGDLLGDGVNVAARLATLVGEGGVCVSRSVYDQVRNKIEASVVDLGHRTLKNLPEPVHALELRAGATGKMPALADGGRLKLPAVAIAGIAAVAILVAVAVNKKLAPAAMPGPEKELALVPVPGGPPAVVPPLQQSIRLPNAASSALEFDKTKNSARCSEILERVQTGRATAVDRTELAQACQ